MFANGIGLQILMLVIPLGYFFLVTTMDHWIAHIYKYILNIV